jgi:hypothetical protein
VFGFVLDATIATASAGKILLSGILTATTAQWDAVVVGGSGGLVPGTIYFLDVTTAGKLLAAAPTTGFIARVGLAISTTIMNLMIPPPIKL